MVKFLSRLGLIFMGTFVTYTIITRELIEKTERLDFPKLVEFNPFLIFGFDWWYILFFLFTTWSFYIFLLNLEDKRLG